MFPKRSIPVLLLLISGNWRAAEKGEAFLLRGGEAKPPHMQGFA